MSSATTTRVVYATHPDELDGLGTEQLRARFVLADLFSPGEVRWALTHHDRILIGGALPQGGELELAAPPELSAEHLCDRRELGVVCLEGRGTVIADGTELDLDAEDIAYVGQGTASVSLRGDAAFYLVSAAAHAPHPSTVSRRADAAAMTVGDAGSAGLRTVRQYVLPGGTASCELTMGITTLEPGSVWNTMPCHVHDRRTEIYLYFGLPEGERIVHLCGQPDNTRSLILADRQAVVSPSWSIHTGAGTAPYKFVWAMAGENQAWNDMNPVATHELR